MAELYASHAAAVLALSVTLQSELVRSGQLASASLRSFVAQLPMQQSVNPQQLRYGRCCFKLWPRELFS
jgi:hypothetical protein